MREGLAKAKEARKLLEYSEDFDEPTGRTDVHVHLQQPSQPEIAVESSTEAPKAGIFNITLTVVRKFPPWGAVIVAVAAIAGYVTLRLFGVAK